jgi:hypothetical protein
MRSFTPYKPIFFCLNSWGYYKTLWNMYHGLYRDYEVLQEEKRRLWDIIQRNMQSYSERLYALEHAERPVCRPL